MILDYTFKLDCGHLVFVVCVRARSKARAVIKLIAKMEAPMTKNMSKLFGVGPSTKHNYSFLLKIGKGAVDAMRDTVEESMVAIRSGWTEDVARDAGAALAYFPTTVLESIREQSTPDLQRELFYKICSPDKLVNMVVAPPPEYPVDDWYEYACLVFDEAFDQIMEMDMATRRFKSSPRGNSLIMQLRNLRPLDAQPISRFRWCADQGSGRSPALT
jgi:hypothetical protein